MRASAIARKMAHVAASVTAVITLEDKSAVPGVMTKLAAWVTTHVALEFICAAPGFMINLATSVTADITLELRDVVVLVKVRLRNAVPCKMPLDPALVSTPIVAVRTEGARLSYCWVGH